MDFQIDSEGEGFGAQQRENRLDREGAQNGEFEFGERKFVAQLIEARCNECGRRRIGFTTPEFAQGGRRAIDLTLGDESVDFGSPIGRIVITGNGSALLDRQAFRFFRRTAASGFFDFSPTACAVGCNLPPLRGFHSGVLCSDLLTPIRPVAAMRARGVSDFSQNLKLK